MYTCVHLCTPVDDTGSSLELVGNPGELRVCHYFMDSSSGEEINGVRSGSGLIIAFVDKNESLKKGHASKNSNDANRKSRLHQDVVRRIEPLQTLAAMHDAQMQEPETNSNWDDLLNRLVPHTPQIGNGLATFSAAALESLANRNPTVAGVMALCKATQYNSTIRELLRSIAPFLRHLNINLFNLSFNSIKTRQFKFPCTHILYVLAAVDEVIYESHTSFKP